LTGLRRVAAALGLLALLLSTPPAIADGAGDFVAGFVRRGADLATADRLDEAAMEAWRQLVAQSLDLPGIAAFVVGAAWRSASDGEREQLTGLIGRQIAALYARRVVADRGASLSITGAQPVGAGEELVSSRLTRRDGAVESIDWLVRRRGTGGFGIFDIVSDGHSLAAGKRSEYAILLQRSRGDVAGLIEALRLDRQ